MIRRSSLMLTPVEDEILRNATTPAEFIGIGLDPREYLEDTDWVLVPDGDPWEPNDWLDGDHCDTCPHGLPVVEDPYGEPKHFTEDWQWEPCDAQ